MRKVFIIINIQHKLLPDQARCLETEFPDDMFDLDFYHVPAEGWTIDEQLSVANELQDQKPFAIVFVSPVPFLLKLLSFREGLKYARGEDPPFIWIFHNDHREKKELPGGKIIHSVAKEGWLLT